MRITAARAVGALVAVQVGLMVIGLMALFAIAPVLAGILFLMFGLFLVPQVGLGVATAVLLLRREAPTTTAAACALGWSLMRLGPAILLGVQAIRDPTPRLAAIAVPAVADVVVLAFAIRWLAGGGSAGHPAQGGPA